jgi:two-component system, sensor histidine kinase and response regulator
LMDTKLDTKQFHFTETLHRSAVSLLGVINDVLDFSKIEAGHLEFEWVDFHLNEVINEVLGILAVRAHAKGLELACWIERGISAPCIGDPTRIRQILTNLVGNAVKFTNTGEICVRVALVSQLEKQQVLGFEVSDTGIGIDPSMHEKIFDSFAQADGSTTRKYGGTGLGLAIAKQLVERMGGKIEVRSALGRGATFRFNLTLDTGATYGASPGTQKSLAGLRALVVDDNVTNREILHYQLTGWNVTVDCVASGEEALALLANGQSRPKYDFAVLDMHMPYMDGIELAERIGRMESSELPLVMLSSGGVDIPARTLTKNPIRAWLTKPVNQSRLYECLSGVMTQIELAEPALAGSISGEAHARPLTGLRALLVEDNPINQEVACHMLTNLGCAYEVVDDGAKALAKWRSAAFDVILMDCYMPMMDGYAATRAIREIEAQQTHGNDKARRIPIIALTANAMAGDREKCLAAGMDDHLAKPFKREALSAVLERWVHSEAAAPQQGEASAISVKEAEHSLDRRTLDSLRELESNTKEGFVKKVIRLYLDTAPRYIDQMRQAVTAADGAALKIAAHTLKSSSANLGALRFADLCRALEMKGRENSLLGVESTLAELVRSYEVVRADLIAELESLDS